MTQRVLVASVVLALLGLGRPAAHAAPDDGAAAPLVFGAWRTHYSAPLGVALDLPAAADDKAAPVKVVEQSFPWAQRGVQFEHSLTLADGLVRVEVFVDPDELPLGDWFAQHFGFLIDERALVWSTAASPGVPAVVVHQPRSPQTPPRRTTLLRLGDWTLLVTCERLDVPEHVKLCDGVVRSLRPALPPRPESDGAPGALPEPSVGGEVAP
jgi:hypothetical protein